MRTLIILAVGFIGGALTTAYVSGAVTFIKNLF